MPHLLGKTTVTLSLTLTLNPNPNLDQDLTPAFCVLLKNCLTSPDLRERMVNDGAVRPLVQLLHKSEIRGAQRSPAVVAAAASAVWNISAHESAKVRVRVRARVRVRVRVRAAPTFSSPASRRFSALFTASRSLGFSALASRARALG